MNDGDPRGTDWSDKECDLIVSDYFDMLNLELRNESYTKLHRNAALQEITHRTRPSIEFKHRNISAVLSLLGLPWIAGYKPAANFQKSLVNSIDRLLSERNVWPEKTPSDDNGLSEVGDLYYEPPPEMTGAGKPLPAHMTGLIVKFDPAKRDAGNRRLGKQGEELVFSSERMRLTGQGRDDLARKVRWISQEDGDGAGYDIHSFDYDGNDRLLEVKSTNGGKLTPFFLSENERSLSTDRPGAFRLVRVYEVSNSAKAFRLTPPLEDFVSLLPANYKATFYDYCSAD